MPYDDWLMNWPITMLEIQGEADAIREEVFVFLPDGSSLFMPVFDGLHSALIKA